MIPSPASAPMGLAFDGVNLISADGESGKIYKHLGIAGEILDSFNSPGEKPTGLTFQETGC